MAIAILGGASCLGAEPYPPDVAMPAYRLPEALRTSDGTVVTTAEQWSKGRRQETLELFRTHVYGRVPTTKYKQSFQVVREDKMALAGAATLREVDVRITRGDKSLNIRVHLFFPNKIDKPQLFYNTGIYTYVWLLRNEKPESHRGRVMLIDARQQFDKEPKAFGNKRNRIADAHRQWIETRYRDGWAERFEDDDVKLYHTTDFAYHKVSVVFWQTDAEDRPAIVTEPYQKAFTAANMAREQAFYDSALQFAVQARRGDRTVEIRFSLNPDDSFATVWGDAVRKAFAAELAELTKDIAEARERNKATKAFIDGLALQVTWTHRHYVADEEYIPFDPAGEPDEYIAAFLEREIAKPILRWQDSPQLGYEILPNKYFYRYQPPRPASELLAEFWALEKEAEGMLQRVGGK